MAFKSTDQTLAKVAPDEPIFVLRARDALAVLAVGYWIDQARRYGVHTDKVQEAVALREAMIAWRETHATRLPD